MSDIRVDRMKRRWFAEVSKNPDICPLDISPEMAFRMLVQSDPSGQCKYIPWIIDALSKSPDNISWEDIRMTDRLSRCLSHFEKSRSRLEKGSLMSYGSLDEISAALSRGVDTSFRKACMESVVQDYDSGMRVVFPLSRFAAQHFAGNAIWFEDTLSDKGPADVFSSYFNEGPVIIVTLPDELKDGLKFMVSLDFSGDDFDMGRGEIYGVLSFRGVDGAAISKEDWQKIEISGCLQDLKSVLKSALYGGDISLDRGELLDEMMESIKISSVSHSIEAPEKLAISDTLKNQRAIMSGDIMEWVYSPPEYWVPEDVLDYLGVSSRILDVAKVSSLLFSQTSDMQTIMEQARSNGASWKKFSEDLKEQVERFFDEISPERKAIALSELRGCLQECAGNDIAFSSVPEYRMPQP